MALHQWEKVCWANPGEELTTSRYNGTAACKRVVLFVLVCAVIGAWNECVLHLLEKILYYILNILSITLPIIWSSQSISTCFMSDVQNDVSSPSSEFKHCYEVPPLSGPVGRIRNCIAWVFYANDDWQFQKLVLFEIGTVQMFPTFRQIRNSPKWTEVLHSAN